MIALIQQLYQVERAVADEPPEIRRARRLEQSVPLLAAISTERDRLVETVLPKSPIGDAVRYLTNQWAALQRFVEDGRFRIDNNGAYAARGIRQSIFCSAARRRMQRS